MYTLFCKQSETGIYVSHVLVQTLKTGAQKQSVHKAIGILASTHNN